MKSPRRNSEFNGRGCLFVISAPSGAGKSTLCRTVREHFPDVMYSISYTTRTPRSGEQDGIDYHFVSKEEFLEGIRRGRWAEWAQVHGNYYGTSAESINAGLSAGKDILLDIDVQGTEQILKHFPDSTTIFIMPPDLDALRERLRKRKTEGDDEIARRLEAAETEMAKKHIYRHVIVNDRLAEAEQELISLINACRAGRTAKT